MVKNSKRLEVDKVYPENSSYIGKQYRSENESTRALVEWVKECSGETPPRSIVDAGCGDGAILVSMRKRFPDARLVGFDAAEAMVSYATKNLPADIHVQKGDMLDLAGVVAEKFDVVYSVHTLSLFPAFDLCCSS
jgi:trans-aconitate methyltransferase